MPPHGTVLLLVDDDLSIRGVLAEAFGERYSVVHAADGQAALYQIVREQPSLVLMDLRLPDLDGLLLISKIRETSQVPIIVLSARHEQADIVQCLKNGADDVVAKPFELDDLEARVEAVLRRAARQPVPVKEWTFGALVISNTVAQIDGRVLALTPQEHRLLCALVRAHPNPVPRGEMAQAVFGYADQTTNHRTDVHLYHLRIKLAKLRNAPQILTLTGQGLALAVPERPPE